jgi:hypothetical protein
MRLNKKQKSFLFSSVGFILGAIIYETGYYIINGQPSFKSTPFIIGGALTVNIIGIIAARNK